MAGRETVKPPPVPEDFAQVAAEKRKAYEAHRAEYRRQVRELFGLDPDGKIGRG